MNQLQQLYHDFKPTIWFIGRFLILYFVLNISYGYYVKAFDPRPDPVTVWVTNQSSLLLSAFGEPTATVIPENRATTTILKDGIPIVSVFEGCSGLNVMIVFISFLFGFSKADKRFLWFIPVGITLIHLFNLIRITLLYVVTIQMPHALYYSHKYFFTAFIYIAVFIMWYVWVSKLAKSAHD